MQFRKSSPSRLPAKRQGRRGSRLRPARPLAIEMLEDRVVLAALVITPHFAPNIMSDPNAQTIEDTIQTAINLYEGFLSTSTATPDTVNVTFQEQGGETLSQVDVDNGGSGYTSRPMVMIAAPGGGGRTATAQAVVVGGVVIDINLIDPGSGYTSRPDGLDRPALRRWCTQATAHAVVAGLASSSTQSALETYASSCVAALRNQPTKSDDDNSRDPIASGRATGGYPCRRWEVPVAGERWSISTRPLPDRFDTRRT